MLTDETAAVATEVEQHHRLLARWLGTDAEQDVLGALRAAHTDDFTLITTDGRVLAVDALFDDLAHARHAAPGLSIAVDEVHTLAADDEFVVVRFRETHRPDESRRRTTAVLHRGHDGFRWHHVHETALSA